MAVRSPMSVVLGLVMVGLFSVSAPHSAPALSPLSEDKLSQITGGAGLVTDVYFPPGFEIGTVDYTDADGINGNSGTLRFETVCVAYSASCGNDLDLLGLTLDVDGNVTINGVQHKAMVIGFPRLPSSAGLSFDSVYPGDPSAPSMGSFSALAGTIQHTKLYLSGQGGGETGFLGKVDLDLHFDQMTYTDGDGNGTSGDFQVKNIHIDDGSASPGNPATLEGFTLDVDGGAFSGSGGVVAGMPSGPMSISTGAIYGGDPNGTPISSGVGVNGLDFKNTSVEVGAN